METLLTLLGGLIFFVLLLILGFLAFGHIFSFLSNKAFDAQEKYEISSKKKQNTGNNKKHETSKIQKFFSNTRVLTFMLGALFIWQAHQIETHRWMPFYEINRQSGGFEANVATFTGIALILYAIVMKRKNT